eukprot:CAMPEP_0195117716 /NCGR_PEP_ID=MMETSP0448-20130528/114989_1 /TAXON_ID=66468 /ORGANISM="Heterocapsa triquestra, Strain CCMP 448" /LENGTH=98 /DNA_ID=CAMNT_0040154947 /DNA_START=1 /DNA_END=293 /DNA_ORIENTATION=-
MTVAVVELEGIIKDKQELMVQLTQQNKVFRTMKARYELRLQQLREAVDQVTEEKEQTMKEMQHVMSTAQKEEGATRRKAQLEGRLREVSRQLVELKRR